MEPEIDLAAQEEQKKTPEPEKRKGSAVEKKDSARVKKESARERKESEPEKKESAREKKESARERKELKPEKKGSTVEKKDSTREKKDSARERNGEMKRESAIEKKPVERKESVREKKGSRVENVLEKTECQDEKPEKQKTMEPPLTNEEEQALKGLPYYHGYLVRKDAQDLLVQDGDFMVRLSESDDCAGMKVILSIGSKQQCPVGQEEVVGQPERVRHSHHFIRRGPNQYCLDEKTSFGTVKELIDHYRQTAYVCRVGNLRLKNGITLMRWEYKHTDVKLTDKILGEGAFGMVREGWLTRKWKRAKEKKVAVKLSKNVVDKEKHKAKVQEMMKEMRIMKNLKHKNVIRLYGVMLLEQPVGILLEFVDGGSVKEYLRKYEGLVETKEKIHMCNGAAAGLSYLHSRKITHCDVAARNCLYTTDKVVKISDFGLSRVSDVEQKIREEVKLPIKWLAPETIKNSVFSPKTDVYSYGVCCWEIWSNGADPFDDLTNIETKRRVISGQFLLFPSDTPSKLCDFFNSNIFQVDKDKRVSMADIVRFMENAVTENKMAELAIYEPIRTQQTQKTEQTPRSLMELTTDLEQPMVRRKSTTTSRESMDPKKKGLRKKKTHFKSRYGNKN